MGCLCCDSRGHRPVERLPPEQARAPATRHGVDARDDCTGQYAPDPPERKAPVCTRFEHAKTAALQQRCAGREVVKTQMGVVEDPITLVVTIPDEHAHPARVATTSAAPIQCPRAHRWTGRKRA